MKIPRSGFFLITFSIQFCSGQDTDRPGAAGAGLVMQDTTIAMDPSFIVRNVYLRKIHWLKSGQWLP
jgi:hypothetical protein